MMIGTARSCSNIAFIKYWGNRDNTLNIPANGSISMNLRGIETTTTVNLDASLRSDELYLNGQPAGETAAKRASRHLDYFRRASESELCARIISVNNFPTGAGIASSASGFAALTVAGSIAFGLNYSTRQLSRLARLGSGSACRSIPGGFVEWHAGRSDDKSYARTLFQADYWDLVDIVAVVTESHKVTTSASGHLTADTSVLQRARVANAASRLRKCRQALENRDFQTLADVIEEDALLMHAVMMTSKPRLVYWNGATVEIIQEISRWRRNGLEAAFTIDAGANVHVITLAKNRRRVSEQLRTLSGILYLIEASAGYGTIASQEHLAI